jgi:prevent-host-death family protein
MSESGPASRVGVRELRQNLSVYLRRVEKGETLDVTEHGRLVARLGPAPAPEAGGLERMIAEGRARPASRPISALPQPIRPKRGATPASEVLRRMREEERH